MGRTKRGGGVEGTHEEGRCIGRDRRKGELNWMGQIKKGVGLNWADGEGS